MASLRGENVCGVGGKELMNDLHFVALLYRVDHGDTLDFSEMKLVRQKADTRI